MSEHCCGMPATCEKQCTTIGDCTTPKLCLSVGTCKGAHVMPASVRASADLLSEAQQPAAGADASNAPEAEPVAYQYRIRPAWDERRGWSEWSACSKGAHEDYLRAPRLHDWLYETRALYATRQPPTHDASHAELLQIHAAIMCIAEAPEPTDEHTYTVRAVLDMARRIRNYESQRCELEAENARLHTLLRDAREALMPHMALCRGTSVPNQAAQVVGRIERELDA